MGELQKLPNIGKVAEDLLIQAEIDTPEKLLALGSREAFLRIRLIDSGACLHMLYGLEGAVQGVRDTFLSPETKQGLKEFYKKLIV